MRLADTDRVTTWHAPDTSPPWVANPFRLVSLLTMLRFYAGQFVKITRDFKDIERDCESLYETCRELGADLGIDPKMLLRQLRDSSWGDEEATRLVHQQVDAARKRAEVVFQAYLNGLSGCERMLRSVNLTMAAAQAKRMRDAAIPWSSGNFDFDSLRRSLQELGNRIEDELNSQVFVHISPDCAKYIPENNQPFGEDVFNKFPGTTLDIVEAGKCLALNRNTAAVFHLMRVLEEGVKGFAAKLGAKVNLKDPWGTILLAVKDPINRLPQTTPKELEFHRDCQALHSGLNAIKDAWRNPTMHDIRASYQPHEAHDIWNLSAMFMRRLAKFV